MVPFPTEFVGEGIAPAGVFEDEARPFEVKRRGLRSLEQIAFGSNRGRHCERSEAIQGS